MVFSSVSAGTIGCPQVKELRWIFMLYYLKYNSNIDLNIRAKIIKTFEGKHENIHAQS